MKTTEKAELKKVAIILAGGKGERFWPLTRVERPKQVLPLATNNPMILDTVNRLSGFDAIYIVANQFLCNKFQAILPPNIQYIVEPKPRNTAPAIGLACAQIQKEHGECLVFFETADHYYAQPDQYLAEINKACKYASKYNRIVLIGIKPNEPHVGYGYIQIGDIIDEAIYSVKTFKEKPDKALAQKYLLEGTYFWNAGIYISKISILINELGRFLPNLQKFLKDHTNQIDLNDSNVKNRFQEVENTSIDYGVLEKTNLTAVMKANMPWEDIGDFNSLKHVLQCDSEGNYYQSDANKISALDSINNIILTQKKIALIGVHDIAVVDTPDVLFICKRSDTAKIKKLLDIMEPEYK